MIRKLKLKQNFKIDIKSLDKALNKTLDKALRCFILVFMLLLCVFELKNKSKSIILKPRILAIRIKDRIWM